MRINKVDDNINFRMALKVNPKLRPEIEKRGADFLDFLDSYGEKISDIKHYNVVFDDSLSSPKILNSDKSITRDYFAELRNEEKNLGKYYVIPSSFNRISRGYFFPSEPRVFRKLYENDAKAKYAEFKKLDLYEQVSRYSRILDNLYVKRITPSDRETINKSIIDLVENKSDKNLSPTIDEVLEKYKYDTFAKAANSSADLAPKKSFWEKIFG